MNTTDTAFVHVVDDDASMREALVRLLEAAGHVARGWASAGDFLLGWPHDLPGCLVLDLRMPGPSGMDLQHALAQRDGSPPVVFLTGHGDIATSVRAMRAGAVDFLTKPVDRDALLAAVGRALASDAERRANHAARRDLRARFDSLSPRERAVFSHVVAGRLNKQIAADLGACERTVKAHRARVMDKMGVRTLADLVHAADRLAAADAPGEAAGA